MESFNLNISLPSDENDYTGRECPSCNQYFKVKFGTGLDTDICNCPYCSYEEDYQEFITGDQEKYLNSVIEKELQDNVIDPLIDELNKSLKKLEKKAKNGPLQIKVKTNKKKSFIPITRYQEKKLETYLVCNNCGLSFAIYGVFTTCPDCKELSAITIFKNSLQTVRKRIELINEIEDEDLVTALLEDSLSGCISAFDGLGKALQKKYHDRLPNKRNLFQKIYVLSEHFEKSINKSLGEMLGQEEYDFMFELFQARHLFEHNYGEIDQDFVDHLPAFEDKLNRKYPLTVNKLLKLSNLVEVRGEKIINEFKS